MRWWVLEGEPFGFGGEDWEVRCVFEGERHGGEDKVNLFLATIDRIIGMELTNLPMRMVDSTHTLN